jgi:hypothetical protein
MSDLKMGPATKRAVQFLEQFYRDVHSLVTTMDDQMAEQGWHPPLRDRVSHQLGNGLNAEGWLLTSLARLYVRRSELVEASRVIGVELVLAPAAFDEPMCLVVGASFPQPARPVDDIWYLWRDSTRVLALLAEKGGVQPLGEGLLRDGFLPRARQAQAFALPVCELGGAGLVLERVVKPALGLLG